MTLRLAVIGCGAIARRAHIPAFKASEDVDVVAFASRSLSSAQTAASEYGSGEVFDDWRKVFELDIDAVDICSPNALHADQAVEAARAGKHVLVEKPVACTVDQADQMIAAARDAGVVLRVAHNVRYVPAIQAARLAIAVGRVGEIKAVRASFGHSGPHDWAPESAWFTDPQLSGGGALIDLGIHIIDVVHHVTGLRAAEVNAMTYGDGPVEDSAHVIVKFGSGAGGSVNASWVTRPAPDFALMIFGTNGTLRLDARGKPAIRTASNEEQPLELPKITANPYIDFVNEVSGRAVEGTSASGEEGREALAVVCAAYEAARTRATVTLP